MISREVFADLLAELQRERAQREQAERQLAALRAQIAAKHDHAERIAVSEIAASRGRPTPAWHRASAEQAAFGLVLRGGRDAV
ncbi:hypothetical protein [Rhodopseudomonas palustris]|uniref:hypothetical protein n=1 Tax=Rhodopseudomonas palustris TaxID=1076 RepID=UPI000CECC843|nr:hypothetical protein [Rhodopseudomonas palustris]PPQ42130.1 hypothetical protein CKO39_18240 [Rhodopseudomonas palustris]